MLAFSLCENEADERDVLIAIPFRDIQGADSRLAYFSAEREGYLGDAAHGVCLLLWRGINSRDDGLPDVEHIEPCGPCGDVGSINLVTAGLEHGGDVSQVLV